MPPKDRKMPARRGVIATEPAATPDDERTARRSALTTGQANPARPAEVIIVSARRVACDGVGGALGHPRVWIELGGDGVAECAYCDRRFVLARGTEGLEDERLAPGVYEGPHGH
jgi:uncharacterized Zn-finger protein